MTFMGCVIYVRRFSCIFWHGRAKAKHKGRKFMHYRKDSKNGITPPNPDGEQDVVEHITKHRGMKTALTSVSESSDSIAHFEGVLYSVEEVSVTRDGHNFTSHRALVAELRRRRDESTRSEKLLADRAIQYAKRAKEALIAWQFDLNGVQRSKRIKACFDRIQPYFRRA